MRVDLENVAWVVAYAVIGVIVGLAFLLALFVLIIAAVGV